MAIYTRRGDQGTVPSPLGEIYKDHRFVEVLGDLDEMQAILGVLASQIKTPELQLYYDHLIIILRDLSYIASDIYLPQGPFRLDLNHTTDLERWIDSMEAQLPPLKEFILPIGHPASSYAHWARSVVRRGERHYVAYQQAFPQRHSALPYLNRLSDYLFTLARMINKQTGYTDTPKNI